MPSSKAQSRRKSAPSHSARRPALEEEDWEEKSNRILQEHFEKSVGKKATEEDRRREEEDWERTQAEQKRHEADPDAAVQRWRELWEHRVPGGSNNDLEELCGQFHYYSDMMGEFNSPDDLGEEDTEGDIFRLWKALYEAGLPEICAVIAKDDGLFDEKEDIVAAILGISAGIISWGGQVLPLDFEDWSGVPAALQLSQAICANAWAHRDLLLGGGPAYGDQNRLRLDVAEVLDELYLIPDSREISEDPPDVDVEERERLRAEALVTKNNVRNLTFFCWMNGGPPSDLNRAFFGREAYDIPPGLSDKLLREVTDSFEYDPNESNDESAVASLTEFIRHDILNTYGALRFYERIKDSLRESPPERPLMLLLLSLRQLCSHPLLQPHLLDSGAYLAIREAVERDTSLSESEDDHFTVLGEALWIYRNAFDVGPPAEIAHVVRECDIISLIAQYVRMYAELGHDQASREEQFSGVDMLEPVDIVNVYASFATLVNLRSGKNTLRKAMRHSLRQEWYATLHVLRVNQRDSVLWKGSDRHRIVKLEQAWVALGEGVSLDEAAERRDYEREAKKAAMLCSWRACQYHVEKPSNPLMTCKGCGEVKYCSRACQKLDWKEGRHKLRCGKRLTER